MSRATMVDVAKLANVSVGTVSRVVNRHPAVQSELRERVEAAMRQLEFVPDHVAQAMRTSATRAVGVMVPDIAVGFFSEIVSAAERRLQTEGYTIAITNTWESVDRELEVFAFYKNRRMDGIIAAVSSESDERLIRATENFGGPVVLAQRRLSPKLSSVATDHYLAVLQCVEYLTAIGHRKIALIVGGKSALPGKQRGEAYADVLKSKGIPVNPDYVHFCGLSQEIAFNNTQRMLTSADPPTALVAGSFQMTGVLRAVKSLGIVIPEQLSLISIGETEVTELYNPSLTVVRWSNEEVGGLAARLLLEALRADGATRPTQLTVPVELVLRGSCAKPLR